MLALRYFLKPAGEKPAGVGFPTALIVIIGVDLLGDGVIFY